MIHLNIKNKMRKLSWLLLLVLFQIFLFRHKINNTHDLKDFNTLSLFNDGQFASSQIIFEKVKSETNDDELKSDCSYYDATCAIRLNQIMLTCLWSVLFRIIPQVPKVVIRHFIG
jgi:hypothetical protein